MPYKRMLLAVDDSVESMTAARAGFELARQLKASVAIVYVIDRGKEVGNPDLGITPGESGVALRNEAERTLSQCISMYGKGEDVLKFTPEGVPDKEIVKVADEWKADLICMGTHGRSGLGRILTGSVAESVIRHSRVPVLVTPSNRE